MKRLYKAAGGETELARRIGVSRQRLNFWDKIKAEYVLKTEKATGISRTIIRPDIYPPKKSKK